MEEKQWCKLQSEFKSEGVRPVDQLGDTLAESSEFRLTQSFCSIQILSALEAAHDGRGNPLYSACDSNVHLTQKHPLRHTQNNV